MAVKTWNLLIPSQKSRIMLIFGLSVLCALFEVATISSLIPVIGFLSGNLEIPERLEWIYRFTSLGNINREAFIVIVFVMSVVASGFFRIVLARQTLFLSGLLIHHFNSLILDSFLRSEFSSIMNQKSTDLLATITSKGASFVSALIYPLIVMSTSLVIVVAIFSILIMFDPATSIITFGAFSGIYVIISMVTRARIIASGEIVSRNQSDLVDILSNALLGMRDVKLNHLSSNVSKTYSAHEYLVRVNYALNQYLGIAPKIMIESLSIVVLAGAAFLLYSRGDIMSLSTVAAIALGAQKLLPLFQQIYLSVSSIRGGSAQLRDSMKFLNDSLDVAKDYSLGDRGSLSFTRSLKMNDVSFAPPSTGNNIVHELSIEIRRGDVVGIVGPSGSGKSTLVDLLSGLILPTSGNIQIDDTPLSPLNRDIWWNKISCVHQNVFLFDASILDNVCLGVEREAIDHARLEEALAASCCSEFIAELPQGVNTEVGERGAFLSGGQIQRIGIARALYKKFDLLILDEITSALDINTEKKIVENLRRLKTDAAIVVVSHREPILSLCCKIYHMEDGELSYK